MSSIEHEYTLNSVTALAFYQPLHGPELVLAGEGAYLKIYEPPTAKLFALCKVFDSQTVHGIVVRDGGPPDDGFRVAIWGGTSYAILGATQIDAVIQGKIDLVETEEHAPDWILDAAISPFSVELCCIFITAHRATLQVVYAEGSQDLYVRSLSAPSQSILYSAHVVWTSSNSIIVAAGTVFGEIEVFMWQMIKDDVPQSSQIFTFIGHEGSVFGVKISPEIMYPDGRSTRILSSCSDDRTIRVWDLSLPRIKNDTLHAHGEKELVIRETGFRDNPEVSQRNVSATRCMAVVMAHASRIWNVDFLITPSSRPGHVPEIYIFSFGEDATWQQWVLDLRQNNSNLEYINSHDSNKIRSNPLQLYPASLEHIHTSNYHSGKHIWSAVISAKDGSRAQLATGGSDGKISISDIFATRTSKSVWRETYNMLENGFKHSGQLKSPVTATHTCGFEELSNCLKANISPIACSSLKVRPSPVDLGTGQVMKARPTAAKSQRDAPSRYAFIASGELLISTSLGRLLLVSMGSLFSWQELRFNDRIHDDLKSYCILLGIPTHGVVVLACANGTIYIYCWKGKITGIMRLGGKPAALIKTSISGEEQIRVLATTIGSNEARLLCISLPHSQEPVLYESTAISLAPFFVVTSAAHIREFYVLGARNGSLAIYDLASSSDLLVLRPGQAQSDDAITAIVRVPTSDLQDSCYHFLTTCRNGSYSIFSVMMMQEEDLSSKAVSIALIHQCFPPLGPMIEAAWFDGSDLILQGFRSKNFVIWNESKEYEVANVECGGAHRSYAFSPNPGNGGAGHFAYTRASKVYLNSQIQPSHNVLKPGGHGREIKACADNGVLIATGAEDTAIRIWTPCESQNMKIVDLHCSAVIEKHTTGIQHLQWGSSKGNYHILFSAGGSEEFYVWRVSKITGFGVGVVCEASLPDKSEDGDLRIMGFEAETISDGSPLKWISLPRDLEFRITLIYSDSTIKVHHYSESKGFHKIAQSTYTTACLKQILCLHDTKYHKFFTAATDGYLSLWSYSWQGNSPLSNSIHDVTQNILFKPGCQEQDLKPVSRIKIHQSSITAIDLYQLNLGPQDSGSFLLAAAGDDNALNVTLFHDLRLVRRITVASAHAAGITGLAFKKSTSCSSSPPSSAQLITIGVDQRVKQWTIRLDLGADFGSKIENQAARISRFNMWFSSRETGDDVWTSVADPAGLILWGDSRNEEGTREHKSRALVFGSGIEIFGLTKDGGVLDESADCEK